MRATSVLALLVGLVAMPVTAPVHAQCAGFTDVATGGFCGNVTWIKNRQITLGCGDGTTYCPNDPVTRLQMAAFMNRLGNVLAPRVLEGEGSGTSIALSGGAPPSNICPTVTLPAVPYARRMHASVALSYDVTGMQEVNISIAMSVDGGAFQPLAPTATLGAPGQRLHHHYALPYLESINANSTYQFAVQVARTGTQFNDIGAWACQLQALIYGI